MHRNTMLVLAAGLTGAISTAVASHFFMTPAVASPSSSVLTEARTATVDVLYLLERMLDMESYATELASETRVWNDQVQTIANERDGFLAALQQLDPSEAESPAAQALYGQYQSALQRFNQARQQASAAIDTLAASQLSRAYKDIHATVQRVATERGYDRVFSSRMTVDTLDADNTNVVVQEVLLRPVLFSSTGADLTPIVREALGIPEEADPGVDAEGPVTGDGAQPATDPAVDPATPPAGGG